MLSRAVFVLKRSIPQAFVASQTSGVVIQRRLFRVRSNVRSTDSIAGSEIADSSPEEQESKQIDPEVSKENRMHSILFHIL